MLKTLPVLAAVAAAAALVTPTVTSAAETNSVRVSYADLNLASGVGQHTLQGRIAYAARTVCVIEDSHQLELANATNECRSDAVARAEPAYEAAIGAARQGVVTIGATASLVVTGR
jgi:UrcA family protein